VELRGLEPLTPTLPVNPTVWITVPLHPIRPGQTDVMVGSVPSCPPCSRLSWDTLGPLAERVRALSGKVGLVRQLNYSVAKARIIGMAKAFATAALVSCTAFAFSCFFCPSPPGGSEVSVQCYRVAAAPILRHRVVDFLEKWLLVRVVRCHALISPTFARSRPSKDDTPVATFAKSNARRACLPPGLSVPADSVAFQ